MRLAFARLLPSMSDNRVSGRLTRDFLKVIKSDTRNPHGERNVADGDNSSWRALSLTFTAASRKVYARRLQPRSTTGTRRSMSRNSIHPGLCSRPKVPPTFGSGARLLSSTSLKTPGRQPWPTVAHCHWSLPSFRHSTFSTNWSQPVPALGSSCSASNSCKLSTTPSPHFKTQPTGWLSYVSFTCRPDLPQKQDFFATNARIFTNILVFIRAFAALTFVLFVHSWH